MPEARGHGDMLSAARPRFRARIRAHAPARVSLIVLAAIVVAVIAGPWLTPHTVDEPDWNAVAQAPTLADGHWFGTDALGRDLLARTLAGGRMSLAVALAATAVSLLLGVSWGAVAGYAGGRWDGVLMRIVDILYALPFMFIVILLMVFFGRHPVLMFAAIGAYIWLDMARIVRGQAMALRRQPFVEAARAAGVPGRRIIARHIIPNLGGVVVVWVTLTVPQVILVESFLSFLGLGISEPDTSWGLLVRQGARAMESAWWQLVFPAGFLVTTLLCLNFLGDGLRDVLDVREHPHV